MWALAFCDTTLPARSSLNASLHCLWNDHNYSIISGIKEVFIEGPLISWSAAHHCHISGALRGTLSSCKKSYSGSRVGHRLTPVQTKAPVGNQRLQPCVLVDREAPAAVQVKFKKNPQLLPTMKHTQPDDCPRTQRTTVSPSSDSAHVCAIHGCNRKAFQMTSVLQVFREWQCAPQQLEAAADAHFLSEHLQLGAECGQRELITAGHPLLNVHKIALHRQTAPPICTAPKSYNSVGTNRECGVRALRGLEQLSTESTQEHDQAGNHRQCNRMFVPCSKTCAWSCHILDVWTAHLDRMKLHVLHWTYLNAQATLFHEGNGRVDLQDVLRGQRVDVSILLALVIGRQPC